MEEARNAGVFENRVQEFLEGCFVELERASNLLLRDPVHPFSMCFCVYLWLTLSLKQHEAARPSGGALLFTPTKEAGPCLRPRAPNSGKGRHSPGWGQRQPALRPALAHPGCSAP
jgi:hypothetical protein